MKNSAITTTLLSSLFVACGDGVTVGDLGLQDDGVTPIVGFQTPFTPVANTPVNNTPVNGAPVNKVPANKVPVNNAPNNDAGNVNFYRFVSISENVDDNQVTAFSAFMQFHNSLSIALLTAELAPTQDVCTIKDSSQIVDDTGLEATFISAGEVLTVTSANAAEPITPTTAFS